MRARENLCACHDLGLSELKTTEAGKHNFNASMAMKEIEVG